MSAEGLSQVPGAAAKIRAFRFNSTKRKLVRAIFADRQVRFVWLMSYRLHGYPETSKRAEAALATARRKPRNAWVARVRLAILRLQYNATRAAFESAPDVAAVAWNGLVSTRNIFMMAARDAGNQTLFLERGPFPGTVTADPQGVNFANGLPREGAPYRSWAAENPHRLGLWRPLGERLRGRSPARASRPSASESAPPLAEPFFFVPLQKQGDTQLRIFGGICRDVGSTLDMLVAASDALPTGWHIRVKEHPTDAARISGRIRELQGARIFLDNHTETFVQVRASRAVVTVNSSVGLEAMLLEKPVIALGDAFWSFDGLAVPAPTLEALRACLQAPDALGHDDSLRDAFLSFLLAEYYPNIGKNAGGALVDERTRWRVLERMASGRISPL